MSDGSLATVTYLTNAHRKLSQGDLRGLEWRANGPARQLQARHGLVGCAALASAGISGLRTKASPREIKAFIDAVRTSGPMPISLESLAATTRATLAATSAWPAQLAYNRCESDPGGLRNSLAR